jgi:hypothetical protein
MKPPDELPSDKDRPPLKSSRWRKRVGLIEEYAAELREIMKKFRKPLN